MTTTRSDAGRAILAGSMASALVMVAGTILGTARVLLVAPRLGDTAATILELSVIRGAGWFTCGVSAGGYDVGNDPRLRLMIGGAALAVLVALEALLAFVVAGTSPASFLGGYRETAARIGLAAQVLYATFPVLQAKLRPPPR